MSVDVANVITRIRQRSDNEYAPDEQYLDDPELIGLIDSQYKELYRLLARYRIHGVESVETIAADGSLNYPIPADFYAVKAVWYVDSTGNGSWLDRHDHRTRINPHYRGNGRTYRIYNSIIEFCPIPNSGDYEIRYIPHPTDLTDPADVLEGTTGWEEFVIWGVLADIAYKEDLNPAFASMKKEEWRMRIIAEAKSQEMSNKGRIADTDPDWLGNEHLYLGYEWIT